jgi:hypothetical protein
MKENGISRGAWMGLYEFEDFDAPGIHCVASGLFADYAGGRTSNIILVFCLKVLVRMPREMVNWLW